jgi:hypothetical protein
MSKQHARHRQVDRFASLGFREIDTLAHPEPAAVQNMHFHR